MKFSFDFYGDRSVELLDKADEINILLENIKDLDNLTEFCELHKNQRINLVIGSSYGDKETEDNKMFNFAFDFQNEKKDVYNIVVRLPFFHRELIDAEIEKYPDAKFYFSFICADWDTLLVMKKYKVTDIYVGEGMGFELDKLGLAAHSAGIQTRAVPNVAQASWSDTPDLQKFWIRPEDTYLYEDYIDIYEFTYTNFEQQKIYYEIYFNDKKWFGDLREIIFNLRDSLDSTCLLPRFAEKRIRCGRVCMKGGSCQMCKIITEFAKTLEKKDLMVEMPKEEVENKKEGEEENNGERSNSESGSSEENIG